ncbi:hypothetical protein AGMMS49574_02060 [Bacteroidia bacterium]|nr:hypothetical protein AGMMS49574_02060 [Bacteroidia bacterium]
MTKVNFLKNVVAIIASLAATTVFASCEPADEPATDAPAFVEFSFANQRGASDIDAKKRTVKAVAECGTNLASLAPAFKLSPEGTIATVDGKAQESGKTAQNFADAVVYKLTTPDGTTAEWMVTITLPDDCPTVKKYITYNKPVKEYFVEYNGGAIDANKGKSVWGTSIAEAYENKKYSSIYWGLMLDDREQWVIETTAANGTVMYAEYGSAQWFTDSESADPDHDNAVNWRTEDYNNYEYPLGEFAAWVSNYKGHTAYVYMYLLHDIAGHPEFYEMPNNTDVTEFYVRSEKVMDIMCDVYQDRDANGEYDLTFWVDPATGFTLKFERIYTGSTGHGQDSQRYEVTKLVVGKPDWDKLHLHFREGDTFTNIHQ